MANNVVVKKRCILITITKYVFAIFSLIILLIGILCFPQFYYFDYKLQYKQFTVYSDQPFPQEIYSVLDKTDASIQQSKIYDAKVKFKIFLRSNYSVHNLFPWQFAVKPYAITRPITKNIFVSKADIKANLCYKSVGPTRVLHTVLAHEATHVLIDRLFLFDRGGFKNDWSAIGFLWKEEGYAEYIARGSALKLKKSIKTLKLSQKAKTSLYASEYFKYWFAISYLLEKKGMTIDEIIKTNLSLNDVLNDAMGYHSVAE